MNHSINQLINDEAVYRTAPATPGLLNMYVLHIHLTNILTYMYK